MRRVLRGAEFALESGPATAPSGPFRAGKAAAAKSPSPFFTPAAGTAGSGGGDSPPYRAGAIPPRAIAAGGRRPVGREGGRLRSPNRPRGRRRRSPSWPSRSSWWHSTAFYFMSRYALGLALSAVLLIGAALPALTVLPRTSPEPEPESEPESPGRRRAHAT
ncbi:hypothetical protein FXF68_23905 [Actinomadura decatromicini]|uniref:Uncharacterized protein n=1 Tax=Actinomadura decatromicini TaxID=2604572 RepID=A0A5D3FFY5_9ACTN|nr:hypothetical protein FXF68_23905 [Actinomadura decatromicini]